MSTETPTYLKRFARAIQHIQKALKWQPPARQRIKLPTPTTQNKCATQDLLRNALAAIWARQAGEVEQDRHWDARERLLAGHIPTPIALSEGPEWTHRNLTHKVCSEIIALQKMASELVHTREEGGRKPRAQRKEDLTKQEQTLKEKRMQTKEAAQQAIEAHRKEQHAEKERTAQNLEEKTKLKDAVRRESSGYRRTRTMTQSLQTEKASSQKKKREYAEQIEKTSKQKQNNLETVPPTAMTVNANQEHTTQNRRNHNSKKT